MPTTWSDKAERHLLDTMRCPRCGEGDLVDSRCPICGADLSGPVAAELWAASVTAADAVRARQVVIDRVPVVAMSNAPVAASARGGSGVPLPLPEAGRLIDVTPPPVGTAASAATGSAAAPAAAERSSVSVQSVLAVAGAGLFAIAAIVFTFFNPDLTDMTTRTVIIGVVTVLFLGGAWLLARRALLFSAEAIGALGMVFVGLDVYAFTALAGDGVSVWVLAAIGTLVSGTVMLAVSVRSGLRTWLWASMLGISLTPAMLGAGVAADTGWGPVVGQLATGFAAVGMYELLRRLAPRFDGSLAVDRTTLTILRVLAGASVVVQLPGLTVDDTTLRPLAVAAVFAALALLAAVSTRHQLVAFFSFCAGALAVIAIVVASLAVSLSGDDSVWYIAIIPAAAVTAVIALTAPPRLATLRRPVSIVGGLIVTGMALLPAVASGVGQLLGPATGLAFVGALDRGSWSESFRVDDDTFISTEWGAAAMLGVAAGALGALALSRLVRRASALASWSGPAFAALSVWLGGLALSALVVWPAFSRPLQVGIGLLLILAAVVLVRLAAVARVSLGVTMPLVVTAHLLVVLVGLVSWADANLTVIAGALLLGAVTLLARSMPVAARPVYLGLGYAYGLIVFALALDLSEVGQLATLCLTATLAAVAAFTATVTPWLRVRSWYAVLIVTFVPFLLGVVSVLPERSGWAAVSTGAMAVVALALLVTRRAGMNLQLRAVASALIVPSIAVVVINLAAALLDASGSPIALPMVAVIVACVLPATRLITGLLLRRGLGSTDVRWARCGIESSALITAALAVLLALVRSASGLPTTFVVLVILGVGFLATAIWGRRVYGWWLAGVAFTGALWCVWALNGVTLIEPYLLPPALAAAVIGAILVARGSRRATALYATGVFVAVVPIVVILGVAGSRDPGAFVDAASPALPWRALGLLAASIVLLALGALAGRGQRIAVLAPSTLAVAIVAAAAGALQGMRYGWRLDSLPGIEDSSVMLVALALALAAVALAAIGARLLLGTPARPPAVDGSRWLYAPALAYLVAGPMTAIRETPLAIWTLWGLTLAILLLMVVTTVRARGGATSLPPVWAAFTVAFVTAVTGWSEREILRVEGWSLPLGGFLLLAGVIAMVPTTASRTESGQAAGSAEVHTSLTSWPIRARSSWMALAPGIAVVFLASISATGTDPQTWRAILVIGIALAAIVVGSFRRLAAPFILGLIAAGLEILMVFAVRIGQRIDPVLWWITLATAGAVLLVIAVTSERRGAADLDGTRSGRMRDLR